MSKYFVLMASLPDGSCQPGVIALEAPAALEAFEKAKHEYRKKSKLAPNIHVNIRKLFQSDNKEKALEFYMRLTETIKKEVDDAPSTYSLQFHDEPEDLWRGAMRFLNHETPRQKRELIWVEVDRQGSWMMVWAFGSEMRRYSAFNHKTGEPNEAPSIWPGNDPKMFGTHWENYTEIPLSALVSGF